MQIEKEKKNISKIIIIINKKKLNHLINCFEELESVCLNK